IGLSGTLPGYNRAIIPVLQPDGTTLFRPQDQNNANLTATMSQTVPLTGGDFFVSSSLAWLSVTGEDSFRSWTSTPVTIGIRQPLLRSNVAGWDRKEQPVRYEVSERAYREAKEDIALRTVNLFFDVHEAKVRLDNAATNVAVNDTLYRLNQGRFNVGRIGENDLLQSELALLRARTSLDGARLDHQRAVAALRLGLNQSSTAPLDIVPPEGALDVQADTLRAVQEALRNRAVVTTAELQELQADRRVNEARLNNGIGATIVASFGLNATGDEPKLAYSNLQEARRFEMGVQIPLVQWGSRKEGIQAAEFDKEQVASTTAVTRETTAHEAHFAVLQLEQAKRALLLSGTADTVAAKRFEVAYNRYVIGRINIDNLYIAQNEKDQARTQYVLALRQYWQAYYLLRRLTLFDFESGRPIQ
ncbi:MAG TPA: TolC family protein, partial [Gemmatimonadales bacterium]|nr:TolC family protein [Gemmatimonadales bacterium]